MTNELGGAVSHCFYVAGMTEDEHGGIFRCQYDEKGACVLKFTPLRRTLFLTWGKGKKTLYGSMQQGGDGGVAAYRVETDGALRFLNQISVSGKSVCSLALSPDGKFLYSANYVSSNFSEIQLETDGSLAELRQVVSHEGCGTDPEEQSCAHPHCCGFTPDEKYLFVVDLGVDKIFLYPYTPGAGIDSAHPLRTSIEPAGSGPRQLIFDQSGSIAYVISELGNTVHSFRYEAGHFTLIQRISTLPPDYRGINAAAAIRLSDDQRYLLASNRGHDSLAVFRLDGQGEMQLEKHIPVCGKSPRDFNFLPQAKCLAVTNESSDEVRFFTFDWDFSSVLLQSASLTLPRPLCVLE